MNLELNKEELRVLGGMIMLHGDVKDPRYDGLLKKIRAAVDTEELGRFQLHDGTDEAKTEELHKFLSKTPSGIGSGPEWDGDPSGVDIWPNWPIHVNIGDTIVKYENELGHIVYEVERK